MSAVQELSPDGKTLARWEINEFRESHQMGSPTIVDAASGDPILLLADTSYDGRPNWTANGFTLILRHYCRSGILDIAVDRKNGTFSFGIPPGPSEPLAGLSHRVEEEFLRLDGIEAELRRERGPEEELRAMWRQKDQIRLPVMMAGLVLFVMAWIGGAFE